MMAAPVTKLLIGGTEYKNWLSYEIESDLLQPADAFTFVAPNIAGAMGGKIQRFDSIKVLINGSLQMTGFVDDVQYTGGQVRVTGRDLFGHLVDCSATPKAYKNMTLLTLAQTIASAWVSTWQVGSGVTLSLHRRIKIDPGETILDVLLRVAKKDRVLVWLDAEGIGNIGRPNYTQSPSHVIRYYPQSDAMSKLNNVLSHDVTESGRDQFASITVLGSSANSSGTWGKTALQKQTATGAIGTGRSLIMTDGDVRSISQAKTKAEDEIERRAFEALVMKYTAYGFYGEPASGQNKTLFSIDQRVVVEDAIADIDGIYYLTARRFILGEGGHTTELEIHPGGWMAS